MSAFGYLLAIIMDVFFFNFDFANERIDFRHVPIVRGYFLVRKLSAHCSRLHS